MVPKSSSPTSKELHQNRSLVPPETISLSFLVSGGTGDRFHKQGPAQTGQADRFICTENYSSGANIGSHAGRRTGVWFSISRTSAGTYFFSTTSLNIYSLNHSSVIIRQP